MINTINIDLTNPLVENPSSPLNMGETTIKTMKYFRGTLWKYIKEPIGMTRKGLKIVAIYIPKWDPKIIRAIAGLGTILVINAILTASKIPDTCIGFMKNVNLHDVEGSIFGMTSIFITSLDTISSTINFTSSLVKLGVIPVITMFSIIALPLSITLLSYVSLKGIYDIVRLSIHMANTPSKVNEDQIEKLRNSLNKKLTIPQSEIEKIKIKFQHDVSKRDKRIKRLQDRKINIIKRQTDKRIYKIMSNLLKHLNEENADLDTTNNHLSDIRTLMIRKITVDTQGTLTNVALSVTLISTYFFPIHALTIPIVGLIRGGVMLGKHAYNKGFFPNSKGFYSNETEKIRFLEFEDSEKNNPNDVKFIFRKPENNQIRKIASYLEDSFVISASELCEEK